MISKIIEYVYLIPFVIVTKVDQAKVGSDVLLSERRGASSSLAPKIAGVIVLEWPSCNDISIVVATNTSPTAERNLAALNSSQP